jgi:hypothetical protein
MISLPWIVHQVVCHPLAFAEAVKPSPLNCAHMDESIGSAAVLGNEAEALLGVEPFHGSGRHDGCSRVTGPAVAVPGRDVRASTMQKQLGSGFHPQTVLSPQPRKMHPAHIVEVPRNDPRAVGGDDVAQFCGGQLRPVLCYQERGVQSASAIAPVACNLEDRQAAGDFAKSDEAD